MLLWCGFSQFEVVYFRWKRWAWWWWWWNLTIVCGSLREIGDESYWKKEGGLGIIRLKLDWLAKREKLWITLQTIYQAFITLSWGQFRHFSGLSYLKCNRNSSNFIRSCATVPLWLCDSGRASLTSTLSSVTRLSWFAILLWYPGNSLISIKCPVKLQPNLSLALACNRKISCIKKQIKSNWSHSQSVGLFCLLHWDLPTSRAE